MKRFALPLILTFAAALTAGCAKSSPAPAPLAPSAEAADAEAASVEAAAVDAATEAPARALGLKLGFAYTANLMGELEPCG
jgi:hypothetical protein